MNPRQLSAQPEDGQKGANARTLAEAGYGRKRAVIDTKGQDG